ncbi:GOLPH3/VPS74 family protein [Micromonospora narathiwatensis]|uniref:Golgi phosphoprotein 3 (GPP34) n=1 Tax=Micromonospora narathiwatensis TaxID=299146 RepID=A0A1A8ZH25_9ACTN|nr:GPP34 family phosphoprotein [Micromonospora narathiwatensis]SBT43134.1 Golgi phosphoprotein 3 (GPP34) [Micromonospora narathiwatensis]
MTYPSAHPTYRLADALFLIGHDEFSGKPHGAADRLDCGLAGAALAELMFERRIAVEDGRMAAIDGRLWQEPLTDLLATEIMRREGAHPIRLWIRYLRDHLNICERVGTRLATAGVVRREQGRLLGRSVRWPAVDPNQAASPRVRLTAMMMRQNAADLDVESLLLAALIEAVGLGPNVFDAQVTARMRECGKLLPPPLHSLLGAVVAALDATTVSVRR